MTDPAPMADPAPVFGGATERRPQQRMPAVERRRQLLDVAVDAFARDGFHGTSMNDVAVAAGVTKPVLYQHFASKKALYRELVEDLGQGLESVILEAVAEAEGPRQQVEAGFRAYFRWATGQGSAFGVLFAGRNRLDRELASAIEKVESMMAERVASLIVIDELSDDERSVLAYGVIGLAESTSRHWLGRGLGPGVDADAFADTVAQLAWSGLRGASRPT